MAPVFLQKAQKTIYARVIAPIKKWRYGSGLHVDDTVVDDAADDTVVDDTVVEDALIDEPRTSYMSTSMPPNIAPPAFLAVLPREIRDEIYIQVLCPIKGYFTLPSKNNIDSSRMLNKHGRLITYNDSPLKIQLDILLTCRQIYAKAKNVFWQRMTLLGYMWNSFTCHRLCPEVFLDKVVTLRFLPDFLPLCPLASDEIVHKAPILALDWKRSRSLKNFTLLFSGRFHFAGLLKGWRQSQKGETSDCWKFLEQIGQMFDKSNKELIVRLSDVEWDENSLSIPQESLATDALFVCEEAMRDLSGWNVYVYAEDEVDRVLFYKNGIQVRKLLTRC